MSFQNKYQKTDVALTQLESAIVAYNEGKHIEAITLAGASEEIFGEICRRQNLPNSLEKIAALPEMQSHGFDLAEAIGILNHARNCLKHANKKNEDEFEITEEDAYFLIVRSIINMRALGIKETPVIREFCWR